jgi:hypothetical protein
MATGNALFDWEAIAGVPPSATAAATLDRRGYDGHFIYDFDAATDEALDFTGVMPAHYGGGGLTIAILFMMSSATSGNVVLDVLLERHGATDDLDSSLFAAANSGTQAVPGTSGYIGTATVTFTDGADMDSIAAGDHFRLRVNRDANNAADTAAGDLELVAVYVKET